MLDFAVCATLNRMHLQLPFAVCANITSEGIQTDNRRGDVFGNAVADENGVLLTECGADQQSVGLRFGGRNFDTAAAFTGLNGDSHAIPPSCSQPSSASFLIFSIVQQPIFCGTIRFKLPPLLFLSLPAARKSSCAEKGISAARLYFSKSSMSL